MPQFRYVVMFPLSPRHQKKNIKSKIGNDNSAANMGFNLTLPFYFDYNQGLE